MVVMYINQCMHSNVNLVLTFIQTHQFCKIWEEECGCVTMATTTDEIKGTVTGDHVPAEGQ